MKFNKIIPIILLLTLIFTPILAQEARIKIEQSGYGKTIKEAHFTVYNTGDIPITDVTFYVDNKEYKTIRGFSSPGDGFHAILILEPGDRTIEVRTPEGAYDTINVSIPSSKEIPYGTEETMSILKEYKVLISILVIIGVFMVVLWMLKKKPKLRLK